MGLLGILLALALLMWLAYRGWSILLVAPLAAVVAAAISGEPLLAHWTQTFMGGAARFFIQWFPMFLLGGLFGKLMDDSGSISSIARFLTERLGTRNTMLAVVLASALVTYGGVSVFVAFFVLVPMANTMFKSADLPRRLLPATIGLGAFTFTMSALPGSPSVNNAIPMPYFGTTTFAAPGIGIIASAITLAFGMWWLRRAEAAARKAGEGYGRDVDTAPVVDEDDLEGAADRRQYGADLFAQRRSVACFVVHRHDNTEGRRRGVAHREGKNLTTASATCSTSASVRSGNTGKDRTSCASRSAKLWREEYDDDEREWFEKAVELIRHRFFTLKDFSAQGRAYFSEDFDFDEAAVKKNILKEPRLKELLPALGDRVEVLETEDMAQTGNQAETGA